MMTDTKWEAGLILQVACAWKSDMCVIWFVLLLCFRFVTVLEHVSVLLQVRADRTVRNYVRVCSYLQKSEARFHSNILTQHWITM